MKLLELIIQHPEGRTMRYDAVVIVPSFCPDLCKLRRALESICRAENDSFSVTVLVVDDGSPSHYLKVYEHLRAEFPSAIFIKKKANEGSGQARNTGIDYTLKNLSATALSFLDADDYLLDGWELLPKALAEDSTNDLYTSGYLRNKVAIGIKTVESLSRWVEYPFTCVNSVFVKPSFIKNQDIRFGSSSVGEDTTFIIQSLTKARWRHFPIASSFYDYDFKDHIIYPHPMADFVANNRVELARIGCDSLYTRALRRNERNGLLLRSINPRQATLTNTTQAVALYCFGLRSRKIAKSIMKITLPWFGRYS